MSDVITIDKAAFQNGIVKKLDCPGALEAFQVICSFSKDDKFAEASIEELLEKTGYTLYRLYQYLDKLEEKGYIVRLRRGGGRSQIYKLEGLDD